MLKFTYVEKITEYLIPVTFTKVVALTILADENCFWDTASIEASMEYRDVFCWEYKLSIGT